ncbi:uncharacterized protein LOC121660488 isoform X2 [Corvus kubaryi]|uniref:uncharacterized protein LOC121660488 isoform X2 n=1 Tax=Corvus kubaryi TaxID=68294 RepID=UPI001C05BFB1|nr:uncharacterized protein LOC121660488 isoform X2 [Corvus kubaryi]
MPCYNSWRGKSSPLRSEPFSRPETVYTVLVHPFALSAGDPPAPSLFLNTNATLGAVQEGEQVLFRCQIFPKSPATQIVFCKDGVQVHSLKAQQGRGSYYMLFTVMSGGVGTFTCGYRYKDNSNRVRNSALSAPTNLRVTDRNPSIKTGLQPRGPAIPLWIWIWILRCVLTLLLFSSAPIITLILERWSPWATGAAQPGHIPIPSAL